MIPEWASELARLYWQLRAARSMSRPSPRTWQRRIAAEKKRLRLAGVDALELHAVCALLRYGDHTPARSRALRYLEKCK